jgi:putative ABC transport system permease protein
MWPAVDDLRLSIRALRASPIVSGMAVLSLALGIGANTAIFSLVNGLLLRALPVVEPQRLATISSDKAIQLGFNAGLGWNYAMWDQLRQRAQAFDGAFAWTTQRLNLASDGETQPVDGLIASGELFTMLGVKAALGRTFTIADDVRGGGPDGPVAVISDGLWRRRFNGETGVIGMPLVIEGVPLTIVGVTPPGFLGLEAGRAFDVALPLATEPLVRKRAVIDQPSSFVLFVMLRLKPGQSLAATTATLRAMQPEMHGSLRAPSFVKEPFTLVSAAKGTDMPGSARQRYERPLLTVFVVVGLVLLIACANIANLLLARAADRRHELSVRMALGAPGWRLARQLLVESLVLAVIGAAVGLAFATWGSRALVAQLSASASPVTLDLSIDWRVFAFTAAVTVATVLLFGIVPAIRATTVSPIDAMKEQFRGASTGRGRGLSSGLVVAQVALSLVLVVAAGLFVRTFARLATMPLGFDADGVLVVTVDTARANIATADRLPFYHRLVAAVAGVAGMTHAAASMATPMSAGLPRGVEVPGGAAIPESERMALSNAVTPAWFAVYRTAIRDGRDFDHSDTAAGPPAVIVNEAFARRFFPGRRAIGESVAGRTVVGVAADQVMHGGFKANGQSRSLRDAAAPAIYIPLAQSAGSGPPDRTQIIISVRWTPHSQSAAARGLSGALTAVDPRLTFTVRPLVDDLNAALVQERVVAWLSGFFGALALLLAGIGLYGVTSYAVSRRRAEIGIRLALGASARGVVRMVLSRVALLVGLGIVAGAVVSMWMSKFVATLLYGLQPRDPATLAAGALVLAAVGAIAGWLPAHRASRIDPLEVLRNN